MTRTVRRPMAMAVVVVGSMPYAAVMLRTTIYALPVAGRGTTGVLMSRPCQITSTCLDWAFGGREGSGSVCVYTSSRLTHHGARLRPGFRSVPLTRLFRPPSAGDWFSDKAASAKRVRLTASSHGIDVGRRLRSLWTNDRQLLLPA